MARDTGLGNVVQLLAMKIVLTRNIFRSKHLGVQTDIQCGGDWFPVSTKDAAACKELQTRGEHPDGRGSSWDSGFLSPSLSFPLLSFLSQLFPTLSLPPVSLPSSSDDSQTGIYADPQPYLEDVWSSASHSPWALAVHLSMSCYHSWALTMHSVAH